MITQAHSAKSALGGAGSKAWILHHPHKPDPEGLAKCPLKSYLTYQML